MYDMIELEVIRVRHSGLFAGIVRFLLRFFCGKVSMFDHVAVTDGYKVYDFDRPGYRTYELAYYKTIKEVVARTGYKTTISTHLLAQRISILQKEKYSYIYNLNIWLPGIIKSGYNCVKATCLLLGGGNIHGAPGDCPGINFDIHEPQNTTESFLE